MTRTAAVEISLAWGLLLVVSMAGFAVAETLSLQAVSVALVMILSGFKVAVILYRFMELGHAPKGVRVFFNLWLLACVSVIYVLYLAAL